MINNLIYLENISKIPRKISKSPRNLKIVQKTIKIFEKISKISKISGKIPKISKIFKKILYDWNLGHSFGIYLPPGQGKIRIFRPPSPICQGLARDLAIKFQSRSIAVSNFICWVLKPSALIHQIDNSFRNNRCPIFQNPLPG